MPEFTAGSLEHCMLLAIYHLSAGQAHQPIEEGVFEAEALRVFQMASEDRLLYAMAAIQKASRQRN